MFKWAGDGVKVTMNQGNTLFGEYKSKETDIATQFLDTAIKHFENNGRLYLTFDVGDCVAFVVPTASGLAVVTTMRETNEILDTRFLVISRMGFLEEVLDDIERDFDEWAAFSVDGVPEYYDKRNREIDLRRKIKTLRGYLNS